MTTQTKDALIELASWARHRAAEHHLLARENAHLRTEHIASSSAYSNLADKIDALRAQGERHG